jgi:hypothetical protein
MAASKERIAPVLEVTNNSAGLAKLKAASTTTSAASSAAVSESWSGYVNTNGATSYGRSSFFAIAGEYVVPVARQAYGTCVPTWGYSPIWRSLNAPGKRSERGTKHWLADFTVNGQRFRKSTGATTKAKAMEITAELLRQAQTGTAPARKGPIPILSVFAEERFLPYIQASQLDSDTKRYYETGCRLLSGTRIKDWRLDRISTLEAELLQFPGTGSTPIVRCGLYAGCCPLHASGKFWKRLPGSSSEKKGTHRHIHGRA